MVIQLSEFEESLRDARGSKARSKNILITRKVVSCEKTVDIGIIASTGQFAPFPGIMSSLLLDVIVKCVFVATSYSALYGFICPESFHCPKTLDGERIVYTDIFSSSNNALIFLTIMLASHSSKGSERNT